MRHRIAGIVALTGLVAGGAAGAAAGFPPRTQQILQHPTASSLAVGIALLTAGSLYIWGQDPSRPDRRPFVAALLVSGILVVLVNLGGPATGLWGGAFFQGPLLPLALLTGLKAALSLSLLLLLFRWLTQRRRWSSAATGFIMLLALIPGIVLGDRQAIESGLLEFRRGYTISHDVVLGVILIAVPLALYSLLVRRQTRAA